MARGRVLAVDPGTRRVGLAMSDESRTVATPLETVPGGPPQELAERITAVADRHGVVEFVVGLPRRLDGGWGPDAEAARTLADVLRAVSSRPVSLYDERLTSAQAERELIGQGVRRGRRKQVVDQVAAVLILQSFLERRRGRPA